MDGDKSSFFTLFGCCFQSLDLWQWYVLTIRPINQGKSKWKLEYIDFDLVGFYDARTSAFLLYKTHLGKYTNTKVYEGTIEVSNRMPIMNGTYAAGVLRLVFGGNSSGAQNFTLFDSVVGSQEPEQISKKAPSWDLLHFLCSSLCGVWSGSLQNLALSQTYSLFLFSLIFSVSDNNENILVAGSGDLRYNGSTALVSLSGQMDTSLSLLVKLEVSTQMQLSILCEIHLPIFLIQKNSQLQFFRNHANVQTQYDQPTILSNSPYPILFLSRSLSSTDQSSILSNSEASDQPDANCTVDLYQALDISSEINSDPVEFFELAPSAFLSSSLPLENSKEIEHDCLESKNCDTSLQNVKISTSECSDEQLTLNKAIVHEIKMNGTMSTELQESTSQGRLTLGISAEQHEAISKGLDIMSDKFEDRNSKNFEQAGADKDLCIICFERLTNCVFVPCYHMAACTNCASKLQFCPICRSNVADVKVIYRS